MYTKQNLKLVLGEINKILSNIHLLQILGSNLQKKINSVSSFEKFNEIKLNLFEYS